MPPWTAPGSAGADTTRQPASPLVNLTGRDLVGDAEEGDLGRVRRQARRPRSARPTGSAVMLSSLPEAGSTALATHTSISPARRRARAGHRARVPPACVSSESVARHGRRVRSRRAPKATC
ncbi:hypothetical protein [Mycobacterium tuberculosis]